MQFLASSEPIGHGTEEFGSSRLSPTRVHNVACWLLAGMHRLPSASRCKSLGIPDWVEAADYENPVGYIKQGPKQARSRFTKLRSDKAWTEPYR